MNKINKWWDSLPEQTKTYLKNQPIWHDSDLYKAAAVGTVIGIVVGFLVGYEVAFKPVQPVIRYLIG